MVEFVIVAVPVTSGARLPFRVFGVLTGHNPSTGSVSVKPRHSDRLAGDLPRTINSTVLLVMLLRTYMYCVRTSTAVQYARGINSTRV